MKTKLLLMLIAAIFTLSLTAFPAQIAHTDDFFASYSYNHGILDGYYYEHVVDGGDGLIQHDGTGDDVPISNANGNGVVTYWVPPGDLWTPNAVTFVDAGTGPGFPEAEQGALIYLKIYNAGDAISATEYCVSQYPADFYTVPSSNATLHAGADFTWSAWMPIGGSDPDGYGEGNTDGSNPLIIDLVDILIGGDTILGNAQSVDTPEAMGVAIQLAGAVQGANPPINPANVVFSYDYSFTGGSAGAMVISFIIDYTGYSGFALNHIYYWNGAAWVAPDNIVWTPPTVAFDITFINGAKDGGIEVILGVDDPLPVELSNFFVAQTQGEFVTLGWTTQSETDMSGYKIYRSNDDNAENMELVSGLIEAENLVQMNKYKFNDNTVEVNNTYYYWLQAISLDGNTQFFGFDPITFEEAEVPQVVEITELNSNYPNPFNPVTTFAFSIKEGETGNLSIFNAKGQLLENTTYSTGEYNISWDGTKYGSGIYFYKLKTDSYSQVRKMMMLK